jgi:N-methylhydantoinase B
MRGGRLERPSQGILGGKNSNLAKIFVNTNPVRLTKPRFSLKPGDVLRYVVPGGGGYGNPLNRDPHLVDNDVRNSLVSIERAREDYGIVIDRESLRIDEEATKELRASLQNTSEGG